MAGPTPLVQASTNYTKADIDHAADDANMLVDPEKGSSILRFSMNLQVLSRHLYVLGRKIFDDELHARWEVDNPGLVTQMFVMSAQTFAEKPMSMADLKTNLTELLKGIDFLVQAEAEASTIVTIDSDNPHVECAEACNAVLPGGTDNPAA